MAGRSRASADRPRDRESLLADVLRHRPGQDGRGFRHRRASCPAIRNCSTGWRSSSTTPAQSPVTGSAGLGREGPAQADRHVGHVSAVVARHARAAGQRSREPPAGPRPAVSAAGRDHPRPGPGRQRPAERPDRRPERLALSAAGHLGGAGVARRRQELDGSGIRPEPRPGPLPPHDVHVLEADRPAAVADRRSTPPTARPAPSAAPAPTRRCRPWC